MYEFRFDTTPQIYKEFKTVITEENFGHSNQHRRRIETGMHILTGEKVVRFQETKGRKFNTEVFIYTEGETDSYLQVVNSTVQTQRIEVNAVVGETTIYSLVYNKDTLVSASIGGLVQSINGLNSWKGLMLNHNPELNKLQVQYYKSPREKLNLESNTTLVDGVNHVRAEWADGNFFNFELDLPTGQRLEGSFPLQMNPKKIVIQGPLHKVPNAWSEFEFQLWDGLLPEAEEGLEFA